MSQTLYRKYRPQSWADVAGQQHIKVTLSFEVESGRIAHAYLFSGPRGVGKTTIARILAKAINCQGQKSGGEACERCGHCALVNDGTTLDIIEIDAASHRGIDNVRENIIENARFSPAKLPFKVFIIDEVHMLTTEAFNALLKTLEEPPRHAVFILATTEFHKVPATIVSRCQSFDFRKIPFTDLVDRLAALAAREQCQVDRRTLEEIARQSEGCLRDAESLLGKVLTLGDGQRVSYDEALAVLPRSDFAAAAGLVEALLKRDARSALLIIGDVLEAGSDLDQFSLEAIELLRKVLLAKLAGGVEAFGFDLDDDRKRAIGGWAEQADIGRLTRALEILLAKRQEMKGCQPPQLPLELAAVLICETVEGKKEDDDKTGGAASGVRAEQKTIASLQHAPAISESPTPPTLSSWNPAGGGVSRIHDTVEPTAPITTTESLLSLWPEFMRRVGEENPSLQIVLGTAEPAGVEGDIVQVGVGFAFHEKKLNEEKSKLALEKVLGSLLGAVVRVRGVLLDKKPESVHTATVPNSRPAAAATAPTDVLAVAFGGRVVQ